MASQRDIRRRIGAVKNIKQITRAMQFVAASKLKRAQDATLALAAVQREARRGPRRPRRGPRRRGPPAPGRARGGRQAPDRAGHHGPRPGRPAQHEHDPLRGPRDHRTSPATSRSSPSGARAATRCVARASRWRPTSRASATDRPSPTCCRSPGSSPTTSWPAPTPGSTSSTTGSCRRSSSARR